MNISDQELKEMLVEPGYVRQEDFDKAAADAGKKKTSITRSLVELELIRDEELGQVLANHNGYKFVNLRNEKIAPEVLFMIPEIVAREMGVIAFARNEGEVRVGMVDPQDDDMVQLLEKRFGQTVNVFYITKSDLENTLKLYQADHKEVFAKLLDDIKTGGLGEGSEGALVKLVDVLITYGDFNKASDIHIEPKKEQSVVRYRIDGVLHTVFEYPLALHDSVATRIKVMAKMRIDEHRAAQDGKISFENGDAKIDIRVSIVPITNGENIVLRLLSAESRNRDIDSLGFGAADSARLKKAIKNPHGMILVTGPTGCGKTTTIYEILKILNTEAVHISTIEDPVEYDIEGVSQIQVNTKTNLSFASGLRAIVRQDPDIIMVGEIRDTETANIAVNSAMTGHLVLSTLHANDSATTLPRLTDMDIEPFLIASTVNIVIAQRLVRRICEKCRISYESEPEELVSIEQDRSLKAIFEKRSGGKLDKLTLFKGSGCKLCANTGYRGRVGIFEILEMSEAIKNLILGKASNDEILAAARQDGMTIMLEDGIEKVFNGVTTLSEVLRVTKE